MTTLPTDLKTGDIILFSGRGFVSRFIQLVTWSRWSHCGMIIADDPNYAFPLLYESTHDNSLIGLDLGKQNSGVQMVSFEERFNMYEGNVAIRRVMNPDYSKRHKLRAYRSTVVGRPFEMETTQIMGAASIFSFLRKGRDLRSIFCSEHLAESLMALGWLCKRKPSNWFPPKYFAVIIHLLNGVKLDKIEILK